MYNYFFLMQVNCTILSLSKIIIIIINQYLFYNYTLYQRQKGIQCFNENSQSGKVNSRVVYSYIRSPDFVNWKHNFWKLVLCINPCKVWVVPFLLKTEQIFSAKFIRHLSSCVKICIMRNRILTMSILMRLEKRRVLVSWVKTRERRKAIVIW